MFDKPIKSKPSAPPDEDEEGYCGVVEMTTPVATLWVTYPQDAPISSILDSAVQLSRRCGCAIKFTLATGAAYKVEGSKAFRQAPPETPGDVWIQIPRDNNRWGSFVEYAG